jgi:predicted nucleotidyltransferase
MNINGKLVKFASQELVLARSATERSKIDNSLSHLERVLKNALGNEIQSFVRFGSYTRNTILPRKYDSKSDVDLMIVFNTPRGLLTTNTYRNKLSGVIGSTYPNSISKKDFPVVKLELNHIMFDLVPAYVQNSFWNNGYRYYIPDKYNGWRETFPNDINSELSRKNQSYGNNTIREVIRLCKHWNASAGYPLESYVMEKDIINLIFWGNEDTYSRFLKTLNAIAGNKAGVRQALEHIEKYKGDYWTVPNYEKQLFWLKKLLPGMY